MSETRRADLHVHSTASRLSKLGIQRSLHLPECATDPQEVYELAKRRGMDFVTITDHDTIVGALELEHLPDTFVSEELTVSFKDEPQAVHVLCYGITPDDHQWLEAHNHDVEACAEYLQAGGITAALAHPFYAVAAPLTARHRRRLAELFPVWETRNGSRARELNLPAFVYIETRGGTAIGGSDDHAGIDIGRTFTETPAAATPAEFLRHIQAGRAEAHGEQGSAAKWTHAAMAVAVRTLRGIDEAAAPDPSAVLKIVQRVMREGEMRHGALGADLGLEDACGLLRAWLAAMALSVDQASLLTLLQEGAVSHFDLQRRARRIHERRLADAVRDAVEMTEAGHDLDPQAAALSVFDACLPVIPYSAATAFLEREKAKLTRTDGDRPRVALVADGIGGTHGVTHALRQIRARGVTGFEVEIVGTDAEVDRRLGAVAEIEIPFYRGLRIGIPALPALVETLTDGRYDLVHVCAPGPTGAAACCLARILDLPIVASYHTELATYARLRTGRPQLETIVNVALAAFYGSADVVLSPSPASDARLTGLGIQTVKIRRWERGVDLDRFDPALRGRARLPGEINVLYAGRLTQEKGIELLAAGFLNAHRRDPRLHLVLAGGGPEESQLRSHLGEHATFLGWLEREALAQTYASADVFLFASQTDTFGQVLLEAQASGLPIIAVDEGGPTSLIRHGQTGLLVAPDANALANALLDLIDAPLVMEQMRQAALTAVRTRTWESALDQLAAGYELALRDNSPSGARQVA